MAIPKPEPRDWQIANARELQVTDRQVLALLRASKKRVDAILRDLPQGTNEIRRAQLENSRMRLLAEQADLFERLGDVVSARRARSASRAARLSAAADNALLSLVGKGAQGQFLYESALEVSQKAIDVALARMRLSQMPLSQRIYRTGVWMGGRLGKLINETLASGLNAAEFAKRARDWFNPNTPGGVRYAAMRLARTEINNAFHAISAEKYATTPWITQVEWNLSKSHPKPDICNEVHADSPFPSDAVPARPHPQCMCYITPKSLDEDDFIDNFLKGDYDDYLDGELAKNGWDVKDEPMPPASIPAGSSDPVREERVTIPSQAIPNQYSPGAWALQVDNEERIQETAAQMRKAGSPLSDDEILVMARMFIEETAEENQRRYQNGPHEVTFTGDLTAEQQQTFLNNVDIMQSKFPANRNLRIRVDPSTEFDYGVGGETTLATGYMRINEKTLRQKTWPGMPVSSTVSSNLYVLAHEWGHAFPTKEDARETHVHNAAIKAGGMSRYGTSGIDGVLAPAEGYAEAFAEWSLSDGKTTNAAAREYARRFKWSERFGI